MVWKHDHIIDSANQQVTEENNHVFTKSKHGHAWEKPEVPFAKVWVVRLPVSPFAAFISAH